MTVTTASTDKAQSGALLRNISAGLVLGFTEVIVAISLATLMFSGPLETYLPRGIAIMLVTAVISIGFMALTSSFEGLIAGIQDNSTVLLAVSISSMASLNPTTPLLPTVIALIMVTTLLSGVVLLAIGYFHLGGLMRYIPYPVIGGFMAGTGWLLAQGGIGIVLDIPVSIAALPELVQPAQMLRWLPTLIFGLVLFWGVRRIRHNLILPGLLIAGLTAFYVVLFLSGISVERATQEGWLLGSMGSGAVWQPLPVADLAQADWSAILGQAGNIGTIILLVAISLLLNISGLELIYRKDVDLNREISVTGWSAILTALAGGTIGYHTISFTLLGIRAGARGRTLGIITALVCLGVVLFGTSVLTYMPKFFLGGLLLFLGLDFLDEWVFKGWKKLSRVDYGVVLLILGIIVLTNFLVGVSIGVILMVILFVLKYSRTNIIHHTLSGSEAVSHVQRSVNYQKELTKLGQQVHILELRGFIFFGTANMVLEQVRERIHDTAAGQLLYLILDFRRVTGLDSSAMLSLTKVQHLADAQDFALVFTHLSDDMQAELVRAGLSGGDPLQFFPDLDHGLEWCEDQLLSASPVTKLRIASTLGMQLNDLGFPREHFARFKDYLEKITLAPGDYLIRQGEPFSDLYFIEIGQVSVFLELEDDKRMRVRTPKMGTIVGELGFYLDAPRTASVIADLNTFAYRLTRDAMEKMKANDPALAIAFNDLMLRLIAERMVATNRELAALSR